MPRIASLLTVLVALAGCHESTSLGGDASHDPGPDHDAVADAPPDAYPESYPDPDAPPGCSEQGCPLDPWHEGRSCCEGLEATGECPPGDPECHDAYPLCLACGDGACDPHENRWHCPDDCSAGCGEERWVSYECESFESHSCQCRGPECRPVCDVATGGAGWYDSCTGELIADRTCLDEGEAVCDAIGTRSEGWYASATGELIQWAECSPQWDCWYWWP